MLFENVHIKIATWSNYSRSAAGGKTGPVGPGWPGGVMCGRDPLICGSDNKTCAGQGDGSEAAELPCFGTHDYRPHNGGDCAPPPPLTLHCLLLSLLCCSGRRLLLPHAEQGARAVRRERARPDAEERGV